MKTPSPIHMPTLETKGQLFHGLEYKGELQVDYELQPLTVRDSSDAEVASRGQTNIFYNTFLLSRELKSLGKIPKDEITVELLMDLFDEDLVAINKKRAELQKKIRDFHKKPEKPSAAAAS